MKHFSHTTHDSWNDYGSWTIGTTLRRINFSPSYLVTILEFVSCPDSPHCYNCMSHGIQMRTTSEVGMDLKCIGRRGKPPFWQAVEGD